jgi:hypothetical protein
LTNTLMMNCIVQLSCQRTIVRGSNLYASISSNDELTVFSFCVQMVNSGKVFILDFQLLHGIDTSEDYTELNTTDRREMRGSRSPFCTFVVANVGGVKQLKPVAIQTDLFSGKLSFIHCQRNYIGVRDRG